MLDPFVLGYLQGRWSAVPFDSRWASLHLACMQQRVVVITGASGGIGAALAELLAERGERTVLVARRRAQLQEVAARCGRESLTVIADVTERAQVNGVVAAALTRYGQIDAWVNNVGRGITKSVTELTDDDLDEMMRVNVKSALYGMQAVLPHFKARSRGHLVNVSSLLGRIPYVASRSAYSAAKHALNALTASLRVELREMFPEIHVSLVSPGAVATDFGLNSLYGGIDSRQLPKAQPALEVAQVIARLLDEPQADLYTRDSYHDQVAGYYAAADMADVERRPPFAPTLRPANLR